MVRIRFTDDQLLALAALLSGHPHQQERLVEVQRIVELRAEDILNEDRAARRPQLRLVEPGDTR